MEEFLKHWAIPILVAGSLVDLIQCIWVFGLGYRRIKRGFEDRIRAQILRELGAAKVSKEGFKEDG